MLGQNSLICVIEDNYYIRKLFLTLFKKAGYQTISFADGRSTLDWLKDNTPDALLIDILLPDINGKEILRIFKKSKNGAVVPTVAVTGFSNETEIEKLLALGFDGVITKPIDNLTFVDEVVKYFNSHNTLS